MGGFVGEVGISLYEFWRGRFEISSFDWVVCEKVVVGNGVGMEFQLMPAGSFVIGVGHVVDR
jgi:hypothetical protein